MIECCKESRVEGSTKLISNHDYIFICSKNISPRLLIQFAHLPTMFDQPDNLSPLIFLDSSLLFWLLSHPEIKQLLGLTLDIGSSGKVY